MRFKKTRSLIVATCLACGLVAAPAHATEPSQELSAAVVEDSITGSSALDLMLGAIGSVLGISMFVGALSSVLSSVVQGKPLM